MELDMLLNPGKYFTKGRIGYKIEDNPAFDRVRKTLVAYNMPTKLFASMGFSICALIYLLFIVG